MEGPYVAVLSIDQEKNEVVVRIYNVNGVSSSNRTMKLSSFLKWLPQLVVPCSTVAIEQLIEIE